MLQYTDITCHEIGQKYKSYKKNYVFCCIFSDILPFFMLKCLIWRDRSSLDTLCGGPSGRRKVAGRRVWLILSRGRRRRICCRCFGLGRRWAVGRNGYDIFVALGVDKQRMIMLRFPKLIERFAPTRDVGGLI